MNHQRLVTAAALIGAGLISGCAVYPYPVGGAVAYGQPNAVYGQPNMVYAQPAPVIVAPAPVYYGPAYPAIYPSISIFGRFGGGGRRHDHGHGHGHWQGRR